MSIPITGILWYACVPENAHAGACNIPAWIKLPLSCNITKTYSH